MVVRGESGANTVALPMVGYALASNRHNMILVFMKIGSHPYRDNPKTGKLYGVWYLMFTQIGLKDWGYETNLCY